MTTQRLSPAMRNALFAICHGGLRNHSVLPAATQQTLAALQQRGLIDQQGNPTEAGRAVFGVRNSTAYVVWHLVGPQGCGKTQYATRSIAAISKMGGVGVLIDAH